MILNFFFSALSAMAHVFLICAVGFAGALYPKAAPILSKSSLQALGKVLTTIAFPAAIIYGMGSNISVPVLRDLWVILLWSFFNLAVSFALSWPAFKLLRLPPPLPAVFTACITFPNCVALPLVMIASLCDTPVLQGLADCQAQVLGRCFMYLLPWNMLFWTSGFHIFNNADVAELDRPEGSEAPAVAANEEPPSSSSGPVVDPSQQHQSHYSAAAKQTVELQSNPSPQRDSSEACPPELQSPSRPESVHVTESHTALFPHCDNKVGAVATAPAVGFAAAAKRAFLNPCMLSMPVGLLIGLAEPLRVNLFERPSVLRPMGGALKSLSDPLIGISTLIMAASLLVQKGSLDGMPKKWTIMFLFIFLRLMLIPAVGVACVHCIKHLVPWLVGDRLTQLTIMVQFGCTSSQSAVVVMQAGGAQRTASIVAYLYLIQHATAIVTLTMLTTFAMWVSEDA